MKIKCITSENGTIIPIHQIAQISGLESSRYVWTSRDKLGDIGHKLSDEEYIKLINELEIL